jgi:hypothetical protein
VSGARPIKERLTYANVMATLALFVALGGVGYAAAKLPKDSVRSKQIKADAVKASEQGPNSVAGSNVIDGSIEGIDVANGGIGSDQIAHDAIWDELIADAAVTEEKLGLSAEFTSVGLASAFGTCADVGDAWGSFSPDVNNAVSFYRDPTGIVHLRGIAVRCGAATNTIFNLPPGYRPSKQEILPSFNSNFVAGGVSVSPSGAVGPFPAAAIGPGTWLTLDGMTFRCGPEGSDGCPPETL